VVREWLDTINTIVPGLFGNRFLRGENPESVSMAPGSSVAFPDSDGHTTRASSLARGSGGGGGGVASSSNWGGASEEVIDDDEFF